MGVILFFPDVCISKSDLTPFHHREEREISTVRTSVGQGPEDRSNFLLPGTGLAEIRVPTDGLGTAS